MSLLLLIVGTVWAIRSRADPQMEKVREMGKELFGNGLPDPEKMQQFREERERLSPAQREQLREEGQQGRELRMDKEIAAFFKLPSAQQTAALDKMIQEEERRRKQWEARRAQMAQSQDPANPAAGPGAGGPPGGRRNMTSEEKMQQQNKRLDNSTPDQRAQRTAMRVAIQQRRKQLGLPANPQRPGRP